MATNVFDLWGKISIDTSGFISALSIAQKAISTTAKAVTNFAKSSVQSGMTFDKSMSQVAATMGKSMSQMKKEVGTVDLAWGEFSGNLREYALEMGENTAFSASQAADALNYMALAGYDTQTSMEMLPNVLNLAAAGTMDLARASDMVTDTQTAFGITIERTTQMVDEMAKAASTGNTSVSQLGDAFLVVSGLAQELNGGIVSLSDGTTASVDGIQELEIALTAMANAGIKGSEAGTHMRNMLLKLSGPSDAGAIALSNLGVAVFDTEGNMRSLADIFGDLKSAFDGDLQPSFENFYKEVSKLSEKEIAKELKKDENAFTFFGVNVLDSANKVKTFKQFMSEANAVLENGITQEEKIQEIGDLFNARDIASAKALLNAVKQNWDKIGESILNADGAAQKMAETQLDNLAGDITKFESALEVAQITLSDVLTPALRKFVQIGISSLSQLTAAFKSGNLKEIGNIVKEFVKNATEEIIKNIPYFVELGVELLTAICTGLIENLPLLVESAGQIVDSLFNALQSNFPILQPFFDTIKSAFLLIAEVGKSAGAALKSIWDSFLSKVVGATWTAFSGFLIGLADVLERVSKNKTAVATLTSIVTVITSLVAAIKAYNTVMGIVKVVQAAAATSGGILNAVWLANPIGLIVVALGAVIAVIVEVITYWDYLVLIWEESGKQWKKWLGDIGKWFSDTWNSIVDGYWWFIDKITVGAQIIINLWQEGCRQIGDFFVGLWNGIVKTFQNIGQWFSDRFTEAWNGIKNAFSKVGEFFGGIWNSIVSTFSTIGIKVADAIGGAFKAAINGVIWTVEGALNLIPNAINGMISTINKLPGVSISAIPTVALPRLAKGGVLKKGQMAFLEGQGDEAVVPLSQNTEWIDKVAEKLSEKRQSVYYNFEIHIDKMGQTSEDDIEQFADRLMEIMNEKETRRRYVMA